MNVPGSLRRRPQPSPLVEPAVPVLQPAAEVVPVPEPERAVEPLRTALPPEEAAPLSPHPVPEAAPPQGVPMSSLDAMMNAIDPSDDAEDVRDEAEEAVDAAWSRAKVVDWLEPKELRKALGEVGDLLAQKAAMALVAAASDPENWAALGRKAKAWLKRFEESSPEELRAKAETKKRRAAKAKGRSNAERAAKLLAEAAQFEAEAKLAEARRGNG